MPFSAFGAIAPHPPIMIHSVGGARTEVTHASLEALAQVRDALAHFDPEVIVVMSPHAPAAADAIVVDDASDFEGTLGQFGDSARHHWSGDQAFAHAILAELERAEVPAIPRASDGRLRSGWLDHAVIVPLSLVEPTERHRIVVLSLSYLSYQDHRAAGAAVRAAGERMGKRVAFLASGDLSHRLSHDAPSGFSPRAAALDAAITGIVEQGRLHELMHIDAGLVEAGGECGLRSFIALGGFLGDDPVPTRVLAYEGPWGVGYLTALAGSAALEACDTRHLHTPSAGDKGGTAGHDDSEIVRLARESLESWVRHGRRLADPHLPTDEYPIRAGAFVSLHIGGELRGCIGTISSTQPTLAEEVAHNAVEAAVHDPRFPPLSTPELAALDVKVDVLHAPESCDIADLDPSTYGVIVSSGWRRGLLLPDLEGVDDVHDQVDIAMRKAGIRPGETCAIERFKVDRYT